MIRTVHVFQCGSADLYGVTQDQTGANLPLTMQGRLALPEDGGDGRRTAAAGYGCRLAGARRGGASCHRGEWIFSWRGCSLAGGNRIGRSAWCRGKTAIANLEDFPSQPHMDGIASVDLLLFRRLPFNNSMHFLFSAIDGGSSCGFAVTRNPTAEWLARR